MNAEVANSNSSSLMVADELAAVTSYNSSRIFRRKIMTIKEFLIDSAETFWTAILFGAGFSFGVLLFFAILA